MPKYKLPSAKRLHNELGNHHAINGKINYKWVMFNSYVKLPEGIYSFLTGTYWNYTSKLPHTSTLRPEQTLPRAHGAHRGFASDTQRQVGVSIH